MMTTTYRLARRAARRRLRLGVVSVVLLAACDTDLLEVDEPRFATPETLNSPEALPTLFAGAVGDFQMAYSGSGGDAFLSVASLLSDELRVSDTFDTRQATDQREQRPMVEGNTSDAAYNRLQFARRSALEVADAIERLSPDSTADSRFATVKSLEGFAIIALAEGFCGAVPLSTAVAGTPGDLGSPLSTEQLFNEAVARFDGALAGDASSELAAIGKARALLNLGSHAEAASAVAGVPTSFVEFIEHSENSPRQRNPIFGLQANGRYSVADREGGNGLPYRSAQDPRLPWIEDPAGGFDSAVRLFIDLRYTGFSSNVVLAGGVEVRLIEAESALRSGNVDGWLSTLNELRADVTEIMAARYDDYASLVPGPNNPAATLDPLADPGTDAARLDLMFQERAFWLFDTGHRLGDMRRLIRDLGRSQDQVFPIGPHHRRGDYGPDVNFPLDFDETQNPAFEVGMCDTGQA